MRPEAPPAHRGREHELLFTAHNPAVLDGLDLTDDEVRLFAVERDSEGHSEGWARISQACTQAERFHIEVQAALAAAT